MSLLPKQNLFAMTSLSQSIGVAKSKTDFPNQRPKLPPIVPSISDEEKNSFVAIKILDVFHLYL